MSGQRESSSDPTVGEVVIDGTGETFETLPVAPSPRPSLARTEQVMTTLHERERDELDGLAIQFLESRASLIRGYILDGMKRDKRRLRSV
jgi:hypothetical protein